MASNPITAPNLLTGPGFLYWAPGGTAEPTHVSATGKFTDVITTPWINLGMTTEGTTFSYTSTTEAIRAAEAFDPIKIVTTERSGALSANLLNITLTNLKKVLNGGTLTSTGSAGAEINRYIPPVPGAETRCVLLWESEAADVRLMCYQVINSAELQLQFQKAPGTSSFPINFQLEKPTSLEPWNLVTAGTARA